MATILAFITGYAAIAFLLRYLVTHNLSVFVAYRIALGHHRHRPRRVGRDQLTVAVAGVRARGAPGP